MLVMSKDEEEQKFVKKLAKNKEQVNAIMAACKSKVRELFEELDTDRVLHYEPRFPKNVQGFIVKVFHRILIRGRDPTRDSKEVSKTFSYVADECEMADFEAATRHVIEDCYAFFHENEWTPL